MQTDKGYLNIYHVHVSTEPLGLEGVRDPQVRANCLFSMVVLCPCSVSLRPQPASSSSIEEAAMGVGAPPPPVSSPSSTVEQVEGRQGCWGRKKIKTNINHRQRQRVHGLLLHACATEPLSMPGPRRSANPIYTCDTPHDWIHVHQRHAWLEKARCCLWAAQAGWCSWCPGLER